MSEDSRIGVFICECGEEIASRLDVEALVVAARGLAGVAWAERVPYPCSLQGLKSIQERIRGEGLGRVVVAGCTPRTHLGRFVAACEEAGLNRYLFEMVDVREGCALVHADDRGRATAKAKSLIAMGVAKVKAGRADGWIETEVEQRVLVMGAGIAGLSAALHLAESGVKVTVVEREAEAGGLVAKLYKLYPSMRTAGELLDQKLNAVAGHSNVTLMLQKEPSRVSGHVGRYVVTLASGEEISAGAIVVATGAQAVHPKGIPWYDGRWVIDQLALEEKLRACGSPAENVVMIESSSLEGDEQPPWFRLSCVTAIKNAALLRRQQPKCSVSLLFSDIPSELERDARRASALGVAFRQYDPSRPPRVGDGSVSVDDVLSGEHVAIPADLVVLSTPMVPQDGAQELSRMLRLPADERGFLVEPYVKLRAEQYAGAGVFVAGSAHWPALVSESIWQGLSAASRAYALLAAGTVRKEAVVVAVDPEVCRGCGRCAEACPFMAITMVDADNGLTRADHNEFLCTGCGVCASICPSGAITHRFMVDEQIEAMVGYREEA